MFSETFRVQEMFLEIVRLVTEHLCGVQQRLQFQVKLLMR